MKMNYLCFGNKQTGENGKSTFCSLLNYTFGNNTSGASNIITGKKKNLSVLILQCMNGNINDVFLSKKSKMMMKQK